MSGRETERIERAKSVFRERGGILRTHEALGAGIHPRTLYAMRDAGVLERVSRGVYRLAELPPPGNPDLVSVATRVPKGVVCLLSALSFHGITDEIPLEVSLALPRGAGPPRLEHPPVRVFWFTGRAFTEGIETPEVDGVPVRVYSVEKTLADCFNYRNKLGLDVALQALRLCWEEGRVDADRLMHLAGICRVVNVMRPYLEALL